MHAGNVRNGYQRAGLGCRCSPFSQHHFFRAMILDDVKAEGLTFVYHPHLKLNRPDGGLLDIVAQPSAAAMLNP